MTSIPIAGLALAGATILSATLLWALRRGAPALGLLDHPVGHKTHAGTVPVVGGLAVVTAWAVATAASVGALVSPALSLGALALLVIGAVDDRVGLSTTARFAVQIAASLAMVYFGNVRLADFGELLVPGHVASLGFVSVAASVFSVVGVINALNMIDGMDGLSGMMSLVTIAAMTLLAALAGHDRSALILAVAGAALVPFLLANLRIGARPARVFLGDAGSMSLGFLIGWHTVALSQGESRAFAPVTALWIFALPLIDTVSVMWRRKLRGESFMKAGRDHVHHLLLRMGFSVNAALAILLLAALAMAAIGIALEWLRVPDAARFYGFLAVAFAYHFWTVRRWRGLQTG